MPDARPDPPQPDQHAGEQSGERAEPESPDRATERERLEEAARRTREKANRYAARHLGDGLQGEEILDDVLQSAIAAASRNKIERPEGYLFRGVVRRVWDLLAHKPRVEYVGSSPDLDAVSRSGIGSSADEVERNLLVQEVIALMDDETRLIYFRRSRGDLWNTIAADLQTSEAAAQERFRYGIEKVRARVVGPGRRGQTASAHGGAKPSIGTSRGRRV